MNTFKELGLSPMILQALEELKFTDPTAIQLKAIPHLINTNTDLIALAQTGTGKTAAFSLPLIHQMDMNTDAVQALILCPTRELAMQISKDIESFVRYLPGIKTLAVYGGERVENQIRGLKGRPQIVVGTPGRVNDLINRRLLKVDGIKWLVLDEADEMLNMGFKDDLDTILETMPKDKQVLLFSATMSAAVRRIASNYMKNPDEITVGDKNRATANVVHFYYVVQQKDRYQALRRIADANPDIHAIVFCRTRRETQQVADQLIQDHYSAEAIHGDILQEQRTHVMNRFKTKKVQLLVATDVAARGIDVDGLTHVINYNLPESDEAYVHRSGRTGRAHNLGISVVIVNMREQHLIRNLERKVGQTFEKGKIPTGADICEKQLFSLVDKICATEVNEEQIGKYLDLVLKKFEDMDRSELIKKIVSVEFNKFLEHYNSTSDLSVDAREESSSTKTINVNLTRFKINLGKEAGLSVKEFFSFLNEQPELRGVEVGDIHIDSDFSTFEIDSKFKKEVIDCFSSSEVRVEILEENIISTKVKKSKGSFRKPSGGGGGGYNRSRSGGGDRHRQGSKGQGRKRRR